MLVVTIAYYPAAYTVVDCSNFKRKASSETSLDCCLRPQVLHYEGRICQHDCRLDCRALVNLSFERVKAMKPDVRGFYILRSAVSRG